MRSIKVDDKKDLLHVRYDPAQVTPEKMLAVIDKEKFKGRIIPEDR